MADFISHFYDQFARRRRENAVSDNCLVEGAEVSLVDRALDLAGLLAGAADTVEGTDVPLAAAAEWYALLAEIGGIFTLIFDGGGAGSPPASRHGSPAMFILTPS